MALVFVSYRREDSRAYAGHLHEALVEAFGAERVFMDLHSVEPGDEFRLVIDEKLKEAVALIALIGPAWITIEDSPGQARIHVARDLVRHEVGVGLAQSIRVIPVLVGGAKLPRADQLPEDLRGLLQRHSVELSDRRWRDDTRELIDSLRPLLGQASRTGLHALRETAVVLLSIAAVGTAIVSAVQPMVDPRALSLTYTIVTACCLGVALLRREAPSEYRLLIAAGLAALTIHGPLFLVPSGTGGILAQPAQTLPIVAFGCWTIAFLRRGIRISMWAMAFATIAVATLAPQWTGSPFVGISALATLVSTATAWTAFEAWRQSQAAGLRWAAAGMVAHLAGSLLRSYSSFSMRGAGPLAMVPGIGITWNLLLNLAVWMVAMSTGGDHHASPSRPPRRQ